LNGVTFSLPATPLGRDSLHDGSGDLPAVVDHYNELFDLKLTAAEKAELVEFLKSL